MPPAAVEQGTEAFFADFSTRIPMSTRRHVVRAVLSILALSPSLTTLACGASDSSGPPPIVGDQITLTEGQVHSLDSTGQVIEQRNPTNGDLKSLVDSTLAVLKAGIVLQRFDVETNLTTAPLYFVAIHRAITITTGSSLSTWTVIGINDPSNLTTIVVASGYAEAGPGAPPMSVTGPIGNGSISAHGHLLTVGAAGAVTQWSADSGSASFVSGPAGAPCPNYPPTSSVTCSLETLRTHFSVSASSGSSGAGARHATISSDVDVPTMRLTFTF
jgi:hypothetical protein